MAQKNPTDAQHAAKKGKTCPECGSTEIEGNSIEIDNGQARQNMVCLSCSSGWDDVYVLTGYNLTSTIAEIPTLGETIERMKFEIIEDVRDGKVPATVTSFSDLHNHVDANEYGGFTVEGLTNAFIEYFGGRDSGAEGMTAFMNDAQDAIHRWICEGGLQDHINNAEAHSEMTFNQVPLKTELVFDNMEGEKGLLWTQIVQCENELAEKLKDLPQNTAVILDGDCWFLVVESGFRILCFAQFNNGIATNVCSRFDIGLDVVDISEDDLQEAINRIKQATENFNTVAVRNFDRE